MARVLVVGSGASGVHFAQSMLERGASVELVDVGYARAPAVHPESDFSALKDHSPDGRYFLGEAGEAVVYPAPDAKPYGFPPSKGYVFRRPEEVQIEERAFRPLVSFARGGLAEAWTGGSYELRDDELVDFPFPASDLRPHYATVAARIGVSATADDLQAFSPLSAAYQPSLPADAHSADLLRRYASRRARLQAQGIALGRSRVAVLSEALGDRQPCGELGRCLWGCPREALYAPSHTLRKLLAIPGFTYRSGLLVRRVLRGGDGHAIGVAAVPVSGGAETELRGDRVVLAAGALATSQIYLQTLAAGGRSGVELPGLMDNRQAMIPFLTPRLAGRAVALASYQFHMVALGLRGADGRSDVHGQISTLKAASVHPIVSGLPFNLRTSIEIFRRLRAGLGVANIWLPDSRRSANVVRLEGKGTGPSRLVLDYADHDRDLPAAREAIRRVRQALGELGCVAPARMARLLPRGSSVHYAGTLPMGTEDREHTTRADGSVRGIPGLHVVDGAGFPWLPAKNLTFTLMANAARIAAAMD